MGCGSSKPPPPDPNIGISQRNLADLAVRQQDYFEKNFAPKLLDQMDQSLALSREQATKQSELQDFNMGLAKKYDQRYWGTQVPLEDELIGKARGYNEAAEQERMAGQAGADVAQSFDAGRGALGRQLRGMNINLGSAGAVSAVGQMATEEALAKAGAMNKTREAARQLGWQRMGEAAALGRGLPGFGQGSSQLALGAGQASLGASTAGLGAIGTSAQVTGQNTTSIGNLWNSVGNIGVQKYNADVNASSGNNSAAALAGGFGGIMQGLGEMGVRFSSKKLKTGKRRLDGEQVLREYADLDNEAWTYREGVADGGAHVGPYAEDVRRKFGDRAAPGGKMIDMEHMGRINNAGIRALVQRVDSLERELAHLEGRH
ncbi:MAG: hypothetical protein AB1430_02675 [Pseudomonadota bacterium]